MIHLGPCRPGSLVYIPFSTFDKDDGSSVTMTNYAVGDILIYKDGGTTERASTSGFTATTDFDAKTGKHLIVIDLADNSTAGFFTAGSFYKVAIDAVTVDGVVTGGWVGTFRIGYQAALFDTTIASLSSQTSFTLTAGPAEDDALNGLWVMIHDSASAVQCGWAVVDDYTGSTKTVTLAAATTFTAAAGDNISIMGPAPLQPLPYGRRLDVSSGGEAGIDWGNVGNKTTSNNLSATNINTNQKVDVDTIKTNPVANGGTVTFPTNKTLAATDNITSATGVVLSAAGVQAIWDALSAALTTANSIGKRLVDFITGDAYGRLGAPAGASVSADVAAAKTVVDAIKTKTDQLTFTSANKVDARTREIDATPVADIADGVCDEALAGHTTAGTVGKALSDAGAAGDPWNTSLPGAYGAGSAGKILGDNLNATVSSRATAAALTTVEGKVDTVDTVVDAIKAKTDNLPSDPADASDIAAAFSALVTLVGQVKTKTDNLPTDPADQSSVEAAILNAWTTVLSESYSAPGAAPTPAQALFLIMQRLTEFAISGTTVTIKKVDGTTPAATLTLDDDAAPTSSARAT